MRWRSFFAGAFVLGCVLLLLLTFARVADRGRFTGPYSTYSAGPRGARALYLLTEQLGMHPERLAQDLAQLPARGMLVALGGCDARLAHPLSRFEQTELLDFVRGGGVLLVAGARDYLPKELNLHFDPELGCGAGFHLFKSDDEDEFIPPAHDADADADADAGTDEESLAEAPADADAGTATAAADGGEQAPAAKATEDAGPVMSVPTAQPTTTRTPDAGVPAQAETATDAGVADPSLTTNQTPAISLPKVQWAEPSSAALHGLSSIALRRPGRIRADKGQAYEVLLHARDLNGETQSNEISALAVMTQFGKGRVIVLASASLFQNRDEQLAEGAALFARLHKLTAPTAPVLFDEFHLGMGEKRSLVRYLRQAGATPFLLTLFVVVALFLWRKGARFGAPRLQPEAAARGTASFVAAMGKLYQSSADPRGTLDAIARRALSRIAAHHHVSYVPSAAADGLQRTLQARGATEAAGAVAEIDAVRHDARVGTALLVQLVARIDAAIARGTA